MEEDLVCLSGVDVNEKGVGNPFDDEYESGIQDFMAPTGNDDL